MFEGQGFVIAIIAISTLGWVITTWIRARHGYPVEGEWGGEATRIGSATDADTRRLTQENEHLKGTIGRLEERLKVLERIATDPARPLADEIERLR